MSYNQQKEAFISYEANAWFERNKESLLKYSIEDDKVVELIKDYKLHPKNVLEIGCSAGYRLSGIEEIYKDCNVYGIEPSINAIEYGKKAFKEVNFTEGTADDLSIFEDGKFDVVIVGFVFYVIDRSIFFKVMSEIDRVLSNGGMLIIVDFFAEATLKNAYHHIDQFNAFSFKQNYEEAFTASKIYYLLDKSTWNHNDKALDASSDYSNKYSISLLKKDLSASYK